MNSPIPLLNDSIDQLLNSSISSTEKIEELDNALALMLQVDDRVALWKSFGRLWANPQELKCDLDSPEFNSIKNIEIRIPHIVGKLLPILKDEHTWLLHTVTWLFSDPSSLASSGKIVYCTSSGEKSYLNLFDACEEPLIFTEFFEICKLHRISESYLRTEVQKTRHHTLIDLLLPEDVNPEKDLYSILEVAKLLGIGTKTIQNHLSDKEHPVTQCLYYKNGMKSTFYKHKIHAHQKNRVASTID